MRELQPKLGVDFDWCKINVAVGKRGEAREYLLVRLQLLHELKHD